MINDLLQPLSEPMTQNESKYLLILSVISMIAGAAYWYCFHDEIPLMQVDSGSYIAFGSCRTMGYPTLLWAIHKISGSYAWLPLIQLGLHFAAATFLSITFYQLTRVFILSFLCLSAQLINMEWVKYDFMILTESVSGSLLLMAMAFILRFYMHGKTKDLIGLSLMVGLSILMRPVSYALVPVLAVVSYLLWPQVKMRLWVIILPLILVLAMGTAIQRYRNGFWDTESFLGHNLLGKAAIIVDDSISSKHPEAIQELAEMAKPIQEMLTHAPSWQMEYILTAPYYDHLRYTYAGKSGNDTPKARDQYWKEVSLSIIKAHPLLYAKDVLMNYCALWFLWDFKTTSETLVLENLTKALYPLPVYKEFPFPPRTTAAAKTWRHFAPFMRGGLMLSFLVSFLVMGYVLYQRIRRRPVDMLLQVCCIAAFIVHGLYGLTALLQAGLPRYALFAWPAIGVMMLSVIGFFWKKYTNDRT
jgi:hypothetical protein